MSRSTAGEVFVSTYPLAFTQAIADKTANVFLIPNPVQAGVGGSKDACEIKAMQILWDTMPYNMSETDLVANKVIYLNCLATFDTSVAYKDKGVDATSGANMFKTLEQSPTVLGYMKRGFEFAITSPTLASISTPDIGRMWDSDQWVMQFGNPNAPDDGELWLTPNGILSFAWSIQNIGTGLGTPNATLKMFWRTKKLSLNKFIEIQQAQSRQLVTTVS